MLQTQVFVKQAIGMPGEFYDDSPRRVSPYTVLSGQGDISAKGEITFVSNPADGDRITVGATTYTFKTTMAADQDIQLGAKAGASLATLVKVLNGTGTEGTDYFAGTTTPNASVSALASGDVITVTAKTAGEAGNSEALASTGSAMTVSGATLSGGGAASIMPAIGLAYTAGPSNGSVIPGGTGEFRGIAVNPKNYPVWLGLGPTLNMAVGDAGQICRMGVLFVRVGTAVEPDYTAAYNNQSGEIIGVKPSGSAPSGYTAIPNSVFKFFSAAAGEVAVLQLTD